MAVWRGKKTAPPHVMWTSAKEATVETLLLIVIALAVGLVAGGTQYLARRRGEASTAWK